MYVLHLCTKLGKARSRNRLTISVDVDFERFLGEGLVVEVSTPLSIRGTRIELFLRTLILDLFPVPLLHNTVESGTFVRKQSALEILGKRFLT